MQNKHGINYITIDTCHGLFRLFEAIDDCSFLKYWFNYYHCLKEFEDTNGERKEDKKTNNNPHRKLKIEHYNVPHRKLTIENYNDPHRKLKIDHYNDPHSKLKIEHYNDPHRKLKIEHSIQGFLHSRHMYKCVQ